MNKRPAVVTPLDEHMGLDIARSLGKRGIPVYGIDPDPKAVGKSSKYCKLVTCPNPKTAEQDYMRFLIEWGRQLGHKAVLYPLDDDAALLCSREHHELQAYYEHVTPDYETIVKLSTKAGLAATARQHEIPAPQTIIPRNTQEVQAAAEHLAYPVLLKPIESVYWHTPQVAAMLRTSTLSGRAKVVVCQSAEILLRTYRKIAAHDPRMVIQELVPGPDENLSYISFYLDRQSKPLAMFAGRKLRVLPIGFGSASYVRSFYDPDLEHIALRLLSGVQYKGLGGIEFKKDSRDGHYKIIEFNTRFGMWDGLGIRCGVDTPYIAYCDTLNLPVEPRPTYREGITWLDWQRDVRAFWMYRRQKQLTLRSWLRSLQGEKMWAIYSCDDWRPGVAFTVNLVQTFLTRLISK